MTAEPVTAPDQRHAGGRRPGENTTRAEILAAARTCFAERGYDATSVRRIADAAGVDQSLVHHFYKTKENLFLSALEVPVKMPDAIAGAVPGDRAGLGERVVRAHLGLWADLSVSPQMLIMLRSAAINSQAGEVLREFAAESMRAALADVVTGETAGLRVVLISSSLMGLAMARFVLELEPVASASVDEIAAELGPALQTYFDPPDEP
ncbi:TetR family transcriptional regulator [Streptomyces sp. NPDC092952]|uniref:TetR/AcrR family transcriptional regulator n=1 Tax=Streptomyces sp. NPDC092952 TaxID=3366018 RepID=UPI00380A750B